MAGISLQSSPIKNLRYCGIITLTCVLYAMILLLPVASGSQRSPIRKNCSLLLETHTKDEIRTMYLSENRTWILNEAFSSDSSGIDQAALTLAKSSWARFTRDGAKYRLDMGHRLMNRSTKTIWCVYHHFSDLTLGNNTLFLSIPEHNASGSIQFLKACLECMVITIDAQVPGYDLLNYLLAYGKHKEVEAEYNLAHSRRQAQCMNFTLPPPFHYKGDEFCPEDDKLGVGKHYFFGNKI